ncbi:MAG TPA: aminotransferase class I/II-fold pyridoxal phosphate-dependent enzyme [Actinomycetes bacterium]
MSHPWDEIALAELRERHSAKWRRYPADVLPAWVAEMDLPLGRAGEGGLGGPGPKVGHRLHGPVQQPDGAGRAGFATRACGHQVDPSAARVVPDVVRGLEAVLAVTAPTGAPVVVDAPSYPPFVDVLAVTGRPMVRVALVRGADERWVPDLQAVEAAYASGARVHRLCNPHNPTGTVLRVDELLDPADLADRYGVRVVADEIHAPLVREGVRFHPVASLDHPVARRGRHLGLGVQGLEPGRAEVRVAAWRTGRRS